MGLPGLSELAREVELAVKEGDYDTVYKKHPGMIEQYGDILERLEKYVIIL